MNSYLNCILLWGILELRVGHHGCLLKMRLWDGSWCLEFGPLQLYQSQIPSTNKRLAHNKQHPFLFAEDRKLWINIPNILKKNSLPLLQTPFYTTNRSAKSQCFHQSATVSDQAKGAGPRAVSCGVRVKEIPRVQFWFTMATSPTSELNGKSVEVGFPIPLGVEMGWHSVLKESARNWDLSPKKT